MWCQGREITTKWVMLPLIVLLAIFTVTEVDAQVQSIPNSTPSYLVNQSHASSVMKILGIDPVAFPKIKVNIFVDKFCAMAGNLKKENFKVNEDGTDVAIDNFYFTGNASGQKLDLAIVFDDTNSMQPEINAMKSKVEDLTNTIKASGMDTNYSLVSFKDSVSVKTKWTKDQAVIKKNVDSLYAEGGGDEPEDSMDAIEAVLSIGFRPDAQKVILVITDAHAHYKNDSSGFSKYTKEEVEKDLKDSGIIFVTVSPTFNKKSAYVDLRDMANDIQSMWIDMGSADFSVILEQFKGILTGTYVIEYTSPNQNSVGNRTVTVAVNAPGCVVDTVSGSYNRPGSETGPTAMQKWQKTFGGSRDDFAYSVQQTSDGGYIFAGISAGAPRLIKTDSKGNTLWNKTFNSGGFVLSVQQTSDGGYIFTGYGGYGTAPASLTKTDSEGNKLWGMNFINGNTVPSVQQTSDGGYIIAGTTQSYGAGRKDAWLLKADSAGNEQWEKTFGEMKYGEADSVQQTRDGGYIIAGCIGSMFGATNALLLKTDSAGNEQWNKTFGEMKSDVANSVQQTRDGGYIIAGWTSSYGSGNEDVWLIETDSAGNKIWDKTFGGWNNDAAFSGKQTSDGGYIIAGGTSSYGAGRYDVWLIKTDSSGNKLWDKTFGGSNDDMAHSVQQTNDGGYIIAGYTESYGAGGADAWLIKTDGNGNV